MEIVRGTEKIWIVPPSRGQLTYTSQLAGYRGNIKLYQKNLSI